MANIISNKISVKASEVMPFCKPEPRDKTIDLVPAIRLYSIEDGYETGGGEES